MNERSWYPPTSLSGRHFRVELLHVTGDWRWYTEHLTRADADAQVSRLRGGSGSLSTIRIVEAHR